MSVKCIKLITKEAKRKKIALSEREAGAIIREVDSYGHEKAFEDNLAKKKEALEKLGRGETSPSKIADLFEADLSKLSEDELKSYLRTSIEAGQKMYREGKREEGDKYKARAREIIAKGRLKKEMTKAVNSMIDDIKNAIKEAKYMIPDAADNINKLIEDFDPAKLSTNKRFDLSKLREYLEKNPETELSEKTMKALSRLDKTAMRDISFDDLQALHQAVMHYVALNEYEQTIFIAGEKIRRIDARNNAIKEMTAPKKFTNDILESMPDKKYAFLRTKEMVKSIVGVMHDHYNLIIEKIAGPLSITDRVLSRELKEGELKRIKYRQDVFDNFHKDLGDFQGKYNIKNLPNWGEERVKIGKHNLTRGERMALYLHSLNSDNLNHLISENGGYGVKKSIDPNHVNKITLAEIENIKDSMSDAEKEYANNVSKLLKKQGLDIAEVFLKKNNYRLKLIDSYYRIETMAAFRLEGDIETEDAIQSLKAQYYQIGIDKGRLEERTGSTIPIYLNSIFYDTNKATEWASAYIGLEIPLSNASKLLKDIKSEIESRYSRNIYKHIDKGIRDIAGDYKTFSDVEKGLMKVKNRLVPALIGLPNPFPMLAQLAGSPLYLAYVQPKYYFQGLQDMILNSNELDKQHRLYSPEYRERMEGGFSYDIADVIKETSQFRLVGGKEPVRIKLLAGQRYIDKKTVIAGMRGAILQVLDEFEQGKLSDEVKIALDMQDKDISKLKPDDKIRLAYKYADYATERTQAMTSPINRSAFSKGSAVEKIIAIFGGDVNAQLNLIKRGILKAMQTGNYDLMAKTMILSLIVVPTMMMMRDWFRDWLYDRKSKSWYSEYLSNWVSLHFVTRDLVGGAIEAIERGEWAADYNNPVLIAPEVTAKIGMNFVNMFTEKEKEKRKKAAVKFFDNSIYLTSLYYGLPYQSTKKLGQVIIGEDNEKRR